MPARTTELPADLGRWLSATEAAAYLGLHRNTFARHWRASPDLVAARRTLRGHARWHVRDLDKHLERRR